MKIQNWFIEQEYETQSRSGEMDHVIQARKSGTFRTLVGASRAFTISIRGNSNEFTVTFSIGEWATNLAAIGIGTILTGGLFLIGSGFAATWSKKIEADFITWVDSTVQFPAKELINQINQTPNQHLTTKASNEKLSKLEEAFKAGILSEQEYNDKVSQMKKDINPIGQIEKLNEAFRIGIITEQEYLLKKAEIEKNIKVQNLNNALSNGVLTQEEYNHKLSEFDDVEFID